MQKAPWSIPTSYSLGASDMYACKSASRKPSSIIEEHKERKAKRKPRWIGNKMCYGK
jgi:hypothetical protein